MDVALGLLIRLWRVRSATAPKTIGRLLRQNTGYVARRVFRTREYWTGRWCSQETDTLLNCNREARPLCGYM